ncbi:AbrB/MazE/SpoVT family DNA-binding domain-containing protein [Amycolatopsis anabasis]|uniref:AbrB/MazE/SpoVT family DNA-binding domain-containing protein n=1 Tax=Amycolatopsis anabasis TaxID=1840409 RepID=UPI00131B0FAB|nr:AbrB/MazE/SpoVT family DNA-binding domain-containing protein [Amycolatopsis anabasis]
MSIEQLPPGPGKFASTIKVGAKGQIVIPKEARDMFGIKPGDTLLLLASVERGIAILRQELLDRFVAAAMPPAPVTPGEEGTEEGDDRS